MQLYFENVDFLLPLDSPVVGKSYLQIMNLDLLEAWFLNRSDIKWWVGINSSGWGSTWVKSAELSWVVFAPKFGSVFLDFFQSVVLGFEWSLLCFDWLFFFCSKLRKVAQLQMSHYQVSLVIKNPYLIMIINFSINDWCQSPCVVPKQFKNCFRTSLPQFSYGCYVQLVFFQAFEWLVVWFQSSHPCTAFPDIEFPQIELL